MTDFYDSLLVEERRLVTELEERELLTKQLDHVRSTIALYRPGRQEGRGAHLDAAQRREVPENRGKPVSVMVVSAAEEYLRRKGDRAETPRDRG